MCISSIASSAAPESTAVMQPIRNFFAALAKRDKAGMLAEVAPNIEVMSLRKGELRRLNVEALADRVAAYPGGAIAEPIYHPVVHIDNDLAVVWTPYKFTVDGRVDHCGTDVISLHKLHDRWTIVGLADNAREDCK
jgi:ketosteroid isomerase-like protein